MSTTQAIITLHLLNHRDNYVIGISFDYDFAIINKIKTLKSRRYSATKKCWYIPYTKESYADFCKLDLSYTIEKNKSSESLLPSGHAQDSLPVKHQSANGDNAPRQSDSVGHKEASPTSDIFRTKVGKTAIHFSRKHFYLSLPYDNDLINNIKKLNRVWWNKKLRIWICYGSLENLEVIQDKFECWSVQQMEQLRIMIAAYDNPKKITLYRLPDLDNKIAIELHGYGIDHQTINRISGREYQKSRHRWLIPNDVKLIRRLVEHYESQQVQVVNRLPVDNAVQMIKARSNHEKQVYFLSKYTGSDQALVKQVSDMLIQQRYSWKTIRTYSNVLVKYNTWIGSITVAQSGISDIQAYLIHLSKRKVSESLLNIHVSALKFYFGKVVNRPEMNEANIKRPRKTYRLPQILSRQEVSRMIAATDNLKHRTILYTIYSSGLRLGELLNLRLEDIQWDRNQIFVRQAKGKKDRVVMLSEVLKATLHDYCAKYKPIHFLFESIKPGKTYSAQSVQKIVKKSALLARISQKVTPHVLRHCFATHLHDGGTSIKIIQELLGHKDIKTTMIYTHVSTNQLTDVISPLDVLDKKDNLGYRKGGGIT